MKDFKPTEKSLIEATIGRNYEVPKLSPPKFKESLIDFSNTKHLLPCLEELSHEDDENNN